MKNNYSFDERNRIVEENLHLIESTIHRNRALMKAARLDYDDVYQQLAIRLIRCVEGFDPEKGTLDAHINAQLQYELLNCKSSYRRYGFTGAPRDLREKLERNRRDISYLQFQLKKARADKFDLEQKPSELRDVFAAILNEPMEQLGHAVRFHVREAEPGPGWEVVTDHCCLGGCDMNAYTFQSERDALLFARLLKAVGYRPPHNIACPACYEEHMKDCI